jgi:hypothetical protein
LCLIRLHLSAHWVGVDLCANVTCPPLSNCHVNGTCAHGVCTPKLKAAGSVCDDSNNRTTNDRCDAVGTCAGRWRYDALLGLCLMDQ